MSGVSISFEILPDVQKAVQILGQRGCSDVFLYFSSRQTQENPAENIDLAVAGMDNREYFDAYKELYQELKHPVELIRLDDDNQYSRMIRNQDILIRVVR